MPRVYPTHLRGTGGSFAMNLGGRTIGASAALATTQLANVMPGSGTLGATVLLSWNSRLSGVRTSFGRECLAGRAGERTTSRLTARGLTCTATAA